MPRSLLRPLAVLVGFTIALLAAREIRGALGIDFDLVSIRSFVDGLGPMAPIIFVAMTAFRLFLFMPSQLLLVAGGLVFGTAAGTLYGAVGLALSGLMLFGMARYAGRGYVESRVPRRLRMIFEGAGTRAGAMIVALGTAYPMGPISAYHTLAGVTPMAVGSFVIAVTLGATGRSAIYTFFGNSLIDGSPRTLVLATAILAGVALFPLAFAAPRRWILGLFEAAKDRPATRDA